MGRGSTGRLIEPASIFRGLHVGLIEYRVTDVARSRHFYESILGMRCIQQDGPRASLAFGSPRRVLRIVPAGNSGVAPVVDHFGIAVEDFDPDRVRGELRRYGLEPQDVGTEVVGVEDPSGMLVTICPSVPEDAPEGTQSGARTDSERPPSFRPTGVNHIACGVPDVARVRDFYLDLFGMRLSFEDGKKSAVTLGGEPEDSLYITSEKDAAVGLVDHLAISIADFDLDAVRAELVAQGLAVEDDGDFAWSIWDPDGYKIQVCAEVGVYPGARRDPFHNP